MAPPKVSTANHHVTLQILRVETRRDLRRFVDLPWRLYDARRHPQWVPPLRMAVHDALDRKRNPFYRDADRELFLAVRDGAVVGRIAAIENRAHNRFHGDRVGFWGFFECVDEQPVADALFAAAERWLAGRGLDTLRGPMNPSTNYECGLLVQGFEHRPSFMTAWNPPYYDALCTGAGLQKARDLLGFWFDGETTGYALPEFVARQAERALSSGRLTFRDMDPARFDEEVAGLWAIYNDAWERNWGFVPMSEAEFLHMAKDMKSLLDPRFAFVAELEGEPVGFMLGAPGLQPGAGAEPLGKALPVRRPAAAVGEAADPRHAGDGAGSADGGAVAEHPGAVHPRDHAAGAAVREERGGGVVAAGGQPADREADAGDGGGGADAVAGVRAGTGESVGPSSAVAGDCYYFAWKSRDRRRARGHARRGAPDGVAERLARLARHRTVNARRPTQRIPRR